MSDYILIPRVKDLPPENVQFGSQIVRCNGCAEDCWISPSSILAIRSTPILRNRKLCTPCAEKFTQFSIEKILERVPAPKREETRHALYEQLRKLRRPGGNLE